MPITEHFVLRKTVPPELPLSKPCRIAFVAEEPGKTEVATGRPLSGPSGAEFNRWLKAAGINRVECLVANVFDMPVESRTLHVKHAPDAEASAPHAARLPMQKGRWLAPAYWDHLNRLYTLLADYRPVVTVPLGAVALWAVTGQTGIERRRGHVCETFLGGKAVPTWHPAHVLRKYAARVDAHFDLLKAKRESGFREVRKRPRHVYVPEHPSDVHDYLGSINGLYACDIETIPGTEIITCIGFAPDPEHAMVVPFYKPLNHCWWDFESHCRIVQHVRDLLEDTRCTPIFHRGIYDMWWLYRVYGIRTMQFEDTAVLFHALQPELPKSLNRLGSVYTDIGAWKMKGLEGRRDE